MNVPSTLGATSISSGGGAALGILILLVGVGISVLNYVAIFKIITKAGYSGWWILIPLAPPVAYAVSYAAVAHQINVYSSADYPSAFWDQIVGWLILVGVTILIEWLFFYIFAFSDWPLRRQLRQATAGSYPMAAAVPVQPLAAVQRAGAVPAQQDVWAPTPASTPAPVPVAAVAASRVPEPSAGGSTCARCQASMTPGTRFCESCGAPASGPPTIAVTPESPKPEVQPQPAPTRFWEDAPGLPEQPRSTAWDEAATPPTIGQAAMNEHGDQGVAGCERCESEKAAGSLFCGQCGSQLGTS
jgi:hypothetical protein